MGQRRRRSRQRRGAEQEPPTPPSLGRRIRRTIDSFGGLMTLGSIVVALVVVGVLIYANQPGDSGSDSPWEPRDRASASSGRLLGDPGAPVRIIAYEDFSCTHCQAWSQTTEPLIEEEYIDTGIAAIEFRNLAILGPGSEAAAAASECAADQDFFWDYHDILFARSGAFSSGSLKDYAQEVADVRTDANIDLDQFNRCVDSGAHEQTVIDSRSDGLETISSLTGQNASTPTFLINGQALPPGNQPIELFRAAIDQVTGADDSSESG